MPALSCEAALDYRVCFPSRLRQACVHPYLVMSLYDDVAVGGTENRDALSSQLGGPSLGRSFDSVSLGDECSPLPTQPFMGVFQSSFVSTRVSRGEHWAVRWSLLRLCVGGWVGVGRCMCKCDYVQRV